MLGARESSCIIAGIGALPAQNVLSDANDCLMAASLPGPAAWRHYSSNAQNYWYTNVHTSHGKIGSWEDLHPPGQNHTQIKT